MDKNISNYFEEYKTKSKEKIEENKFLSIEAYSIKLNNGKIIKREKILKNKSDGSAAIVLPITEDNKVILAIEPRVFTEKTVDVGVPAGYIEEGEEAVVAAQRELLEETGYYSDNLLEIGKFYQDQGCSEALNHYFIAQNCVKVTDQKLDESEFIKFVEVSLDELYELYNSGYITGLNSAYLIEASKKYLNKNLKESPRQYIKRRD